MLCNFFVIFKPFVFYKFIFEISPIPPFRRNEISGFKSLSFFPNFFNFSSFIPVINSFKFSAKSKYNFWFFNFTIPDRDVTNNKFKFWTFFFFRFLSFIYYFNNCLL
eukprot:Anaeramoba_flamelloidesa1057845_85.p2 GENE.a1057845_85~~a1057845_85.p2  ORF type:complete len:107 (+),score=1.79 a1057845_85:178-498(+)